MFTSFSHGMLRLRARFVLAAVASAASAIACQRERTGAEARDGQAASESPSAASTDANKAAQEPSKPFSPEMVEKLYAGKCPNWVKGASSQIADAEGGMQVTITGASDAVATEIRSRARYLADGLSKGGDATGRCPVPRSAQIEVKEIAGGVQLSVKPGVGGSVEQLRSQARARLQQIPTP
jgi:hypothetical protein